MKDDVGHSIFARHCIGPQFSHEEDLIGVFRRIFPLFGFLNPFLQRERDPSITSSFARTNRQVSNEIEEEIAFGHADHFVENLHEQTETFTGLQLQSIGDISTEVFRPRGRINFEGL